MSPRAIAFAVSALAFGAMAALPDERPPGHDADARVAQTALQRALGPLGSVAASVEWVRYNVTLTSGDTPRAYGIARRALELDPRATRGWYELAQHLIFTRGSFADSGSAEERRRWIRAGLDVLREGEARASAPGDLAWMAGVIRRAYLAEIDDADLRWPGGREALLREALTDFRRAESLGREGAAEAVSELASELGDD